MARQTKLFRRRMTALPATLTPQQIYIIPSRAGWGLAVVLIAMLTGAINYTLSLGFILTFMLAGMALVALLHTWRNIAWLHIHATPPVAVFAGQDATLPVTISDTRGRQRLAIAANLPNQPVLYTDIEANGKDQLHLPLATQKRGLQEIGTLTISTGFPTGLFRAWSSAETNIRCMVYPRPAEHCLPLPKGHVPGKSGELSSQPGDEDFSGLRLYQRGDSPRRIDWKASSREQGMYSREFHAESQQQIWLDINTTPGHDIEQRLSQLTSWIMQAHNTHQQYGLRLPGIVLPPAHDEAHYHACLRALALLEVA